MSISVTLEEYESIEKCAKEKGLNRSEFILGLFKKENERTN